MEIKQNFNISVGQCVSGGVSVTQGFTADFLSGLAISEHITYAAKQFPWKGTGYEVAAAEGGGFEVTRGEPLIGVLSECWLAPLTADQCY